MKHTKHTFLFPAVGALAVAFALIPDHNAKAQMLTVPNFSFETQTLNDNDYRNYDNGTAADGFLYAGGQAAGIENTSGKFTGDNTGTGTLPAPGDGMNAAFINNGGNSGTITSSASLAAVTFGTTYTLTVAVGNPAGGGTQTPGNFTIQLLVNGTAATTFASTDANAITDGSFQDFTTSFTTTAAQAGGALTVQLGETASNTTGGNNAQVFFDNIRVNAVVPEPGTWAAVACGVGLLLVVRRSRAQC